MTRAKTQYDEVMDKEVLWLRKFIKKLENTPTAHGAKWKFAMLQHYRRKLRELRRERRKPR